MKPDTKKYIIAGSLAVVSVALAAAYLQYRRLMNYVITIKKIKIKKITYSLLDFDLLLNFKNNSDVAFTIISQKYDVYVNDVLVAKLTGKEVVPIKGKSETLLPINVNVDPSSVFKKLGKSVLSLLAETDKLIIKIDIKLQVKLWMFTINIPYIFQDNLKNMMAKKEA